MRLASEVAMPLTDRGGRRQGAESGFERTLRIGAGGREAADRFGCRG